MNKGHFSKFSVFRRESLKSVCRLTKYGRRHVELPYARDLYPKKGRGIVDERSPIRSVSLCRTALKPSPELPGVRSNNIFLEKGRYK